MKATKISYAINNQKEDVIMNMFIEKVLDNKEFSWSAKRFIGYYTDIVDKHSEHESVNADMKHTEIVKFFIDYIKSLQNFENFKKWLHDIKMKDALICDNIPSDGYFFKEWLLPFKTVEDAFSFYNENVNKMLGVK